MRPSTRIMRSSTASASARTELCTADSTHARCPAASSSGLPPPFLLGRSIGSKASAIRLAFMSPQGLRAMLSASAMRDSGCDARPALPVQGAPLAAKRSSRLHP